MQFRNNVYKMKEGRDIKASVFSKLVSTTLFEHRWGPYFVSPVIAGLDKVSENEYQPVICTYDSIGYRSHSGQFEVAGTGGELLYGVCESFYKDNMEPEELFEVISNCLLSAIDRDSLSGWGAKVYLLTPEKLTVRTLKTR